MKWNLDSRTTPRWATNIGFTAVLLTVLWGFAVHGHSRVELLPSQEPSRTFGGREGTLQVVWHNQSGNRLRLSVSARVYQTGSATAAPYSKRLWKTLELLPSQTVVESAMIDFPLVRGETPFLIQWIEGTNHVLGVTEVLVYPPDLLKELANLAGQKPLGVFDPTDQLKPLLKAQKVAYFDFELSTFDNFEPVLAIIGPFTSKGQMREGLGREIKMPARKGAAVVWFQPPPERHDHLKPSFYTVPEGKGAVVVAQAGLVAKLSEDPQAQLNLIQLCREALHPEPPRLPDLVSQP